MSFEGPSFPQTAERTLTAIVILPHLARPSYAKSSTPSARSKLRVGRAGLLRVGCASRASAQKWFSHEEREWWSCSFRVVIFCFYSIATTRMVSHFPLWVLPRLPLSAFALHCHCRIRELTASPRAKVFPCQVIVSCNPDVSGTILHGRTPVMLQPSGDRLSKKVDPKNEK